MKHFAQKLSIILLGILLVLSFQNCGDSLHVAEENFILQASQDSSIYATIILQGRLETSSIITAKISSEEEIQKVDWSIDCDSGFVSTSLNNEFYFHCKNPGKIKLYAQVHFLNGEVHSLVEPYSMVGSSNLLIEDLVDIELPESLIQSGEYIEAKAVFNSEVNAKVSWIYSCYEGAEEINLTDVDPRYSSLLSICALPDDFPNHRSVGKVAIQIGQTVILEKSFEITKN